MLRMPDHKIDVSHSFHSYRWAIVLVCGLLLFLCAENLYYYGLNIEKWDLLLISGVLTFIPAIRLAFNIPVRQDQMLNRLAQRGSLIISEDKLQALKKRIHTEVKKWSMIGGVVLAICIFLAFLIAFGYQTITYKLVLTILEVTGGYLAGTFLGAMACYGRLGKMINNLRIALKVQPGHIDGVAGLKPIGEFYFNQAKICALPALFLAVCLLIIQFGNTRYEVWRVPYAALLGIAIIIEVLVFFVPLIFFHQEMVEQKRDYQQQADQMSKEILKLQHELTQEQQAPSRELLKDRLASLTKEYWDIENLPTWPVGIKTGRLFTRNNFALILPLMIELLSKTSLGKSAWWNSATEVVKDLFK